MAISSRKSFFNINDFNARLAILEHQVCKLERAYRNGKGGLMVTGFLVAPDIILTTSRIFEPNHMKGTEEFFPEEVKVSFDYVLQNGTLSKEYCSFDLDNNNYLIELWKDYVLFRLNHLAGFDDVSTGAKRGWIEITNKLIDPPVENSPLLIIQHPVGLPLSVSVNTESIVSLDHKNKRLQYLTDTKPGSAGAPCFNMDLQIIAMHLGRTKLSHSSTEERFSNEGVLISKIVEDITNKGLSELVSQKPSYEITNSHTTVVQPLKADDHHDRLINELERYIKQGEGQRVEFKQTACLNHKTNQKEGSIQSSIVQTVASFMNSLEGGFLFIGVEDNGNIIGVEKEYSIANSQKSNWDGYLLFINDLLRGSLDAKTSYGFYQIEKYSKNSADICCIIVKPADEPVYYRDEFFIRDMAQTRKIKGRDVHEYIKKRWLNRH